MFDCIIQILDFVIKLSIVLGIVLLANFYLRILFLDKKIEKFNKAFEEERDSKRGQGRGMTESFINGEINSLEKTKNEKIAPLERERQRLISKIPFLK